MSTAIFYDEGQRFSDDQENFEAILRPMLDAWLPAFRDARTNSVISADIPTYLKNVALMAWLPAKGNIPVSQDTINAFREIFVIARHDILENPVHDGMNSTVRDRLEKSAMRLAMAITVLDLANDAGIAELFANAREQDDNPLY